MALYVVSTQIGNLEDITLRAIRILTEVEIILAEDTRRTLILLNHYKIKNKKLISFNDYNKEKKTADIVKDLKNNKEIAIVSDAGTPGISDPGFYLIRECKKNNIKVIPIPGPTALISALVASGFPTDSFVFYGFIPKKEKAKIDFFKSIKNETVVFYESPHRIMKTLKTMSEIMPDRKVCIARELTKKFEEFITGSCRETYEKIMDKKIKGEITVVISKE